MPLLRNVADLRLNSTLGGSPPNSASISSFERHFLKKSRSANGIPACESAALAVLHVPQPTQWYSATPTICTPPVRPPMVRTCLPRALLPDAVIPPEAGISQP